jgi:hypothetical protein
MAQSVNRPGLLSKQQDEGEQQRKEEGTRIFHDYCNHNKNSSTTEHQLLFHNVTQSLSTGKKGG